MSRPRPKYKRPYSLFPFLTLFRSPPPQGAALLLCRLALSGHSSTAVMTGLGADGFLAGMVPLRPFGLGWERHQDGFDIAAGFEAEQGADRKSTRLNSSH